MILKKLISFFIDRVLYARKGGEDVQSQAVNLGGDKISVDDATVSFCNPLSYLYKCGI